MLGVTTSAWQSAYLHFSDPLGFRLRRTILNLLSPLCVTPRSGDRSMCKYGFAAARHSFHRPGDYAGQLHTRTHTHSIIHIPSRQQPPLCIPRWHPSLHSKTQSPQIVS